MKNNYLALLIICVVVNGPVVAMVTGEEYKVASPYTASDRNKMQVINNYYNRAGGYYQENINKFQDKMGQFANDSGNKGLMENMYDYARNMEDPANAFNRQFSKNDIMGIGNTGHDKNVAGMQFNAAKSEYVDRGYKVRDNIVNYASEVRNNYISAEENSKLARGVQFAATIALSLIVPGSSAVLLATDTAMYAYNESEYQKYGLKGSDGQAGINNVYSATVGVINGIEAINNTKDMVNGMKKMGGYSSFGELQAFQKMQAYSSYVSAYSSFAQSAITLSGDREGYSNLTRFISGAQAFSGLISPSYTGMNKNDNSMFFSLKEGGVSGMAYNTTVVLGKMQKAAVLEYAIKGGNSVIGRNQREYLYISQGIAVASAYGKTYLKRDALENKMRYLNDEWGKSFERPSIDNSINREKYREIYAQNVKRINDRTYKTRTEKDGSVYTSGIEAQITQLMNTNDGFYRMSHGNEMFNNFRNEIQNNARGR